MRRWSYHIPILGYHRVGNLRADHVPTVSGEAFERQLQFLARSGYRVLNLDDVVAILDRGERLPRRSTVLTFDDGYEETYTVAWPLLKRFGFTATVFVTPAEVGLPGFATWDQVSELSRAGITIGSHTMHHKYLPLVIAERLHEELVESKLVIEERIGHAVHFLSYPVGGFTVEVQDVARRAGYLAACTTNRSLSSTNGIDRFALRRIKVTEYDAKPFLFFAKLSGYYDAFRQLKQPA